jgi:hypothetical protein
MSWLFSQALVEAYSADICSDGEQSAPLNGNHIQQAYCASDKMKDFSRLSRFGMTYKPLTDDLGAGVLTWCLAASLVRTFPQQEKAPESMEHEAECGDTWRESFARWDPATSLWKTLQCSLLEGLDVFSETWPKWGMMRAGECSVRSMPVLRISVTEFGSSELWPTPCLPGNGWSNGKAKMKAMLWPTPIATLWKDGKSSPGYGLNLSEAVKMWPTPCATDHKGSGKAGTLRDRLDYAAERGAIKSNTYATPQARDFRSGSTDRWDNPERSRNLNDQIGGQLNPTWVEWLMGWPLGWTDLKPLGTDKYQAWQRSHGGY